MDNDIFYESTDIEFLKILIKSIESDILNIESEINRLSMIKSANDLNISFVEFKQQ